MAGLAWSEGRGVEVVAGNGGEEEVEARPSGNSEKAGHWLPKIQPETVSKILP